MSSEMSDENAMANAKALMKRKEEIEKEIKEVNDFLNEKGVGLKGGLVDAEGFPLNDVDKVIAVREARGRNAVLQNDHKEIMKQIELALVAVHSVSKQAREKSPIASNEHQKVQPKEDFSEEYKDSKPFARVNEVSPASPASAATLRSGDLILHFGSANSENHNGLKGVAEVVKDSEGRQVKVVVRRTDPTGTHVKVLMLTPKKWEGRGLLGCHVVPI